MEYIPPISLLDTLMFPYIVLLLIALVGIFVWLECSERDFVMVNGRIKEVRRIPFWEREV